MSNNQPVLLNCPTCGAPLDFDGNNSVIRCKFCGNRSFVEGAKPDQASKSSSTVDEIRQLLSSGNLEGAISHYHTQYGVDLEEANDAIEAIQAGHYATPFVNGSHTPAELTQALQQIQNLLSGGNKLEAIKLYRETFDSSMARALEAIKSLEDGKELKIENDYETYENLTPPLSMPPYPPQKSNKKGCRTSSIVLVVVLILGIAGFILATKNGLFLPHYYAYSPEILISGSPDTQPQIAGLFYDSGADARFIGLVNTGTKRLLWKTAPFNGDGFVSNLVDSSDLIYAANEDNLLAYNKSDGGLAWQTVMPDALNYSGNNLIVDSGRVITFNADQSIQAYNAETGGLVWSKRLSGYSNNILMTDHSLVVVDFTDTNNNYGLFFLDPITGNQQDILTPICSVNGYDNTLESDSVLFLDKADQVLYLIFTEGCIQKLDLSTREIVWDSKNTDYFSSSLEPNNYLLTESNLYFGDDGDLLSVAKSTGEIKKISQNADYNVYPLDISKGVLILRADRTRGTSRSELWGVDSSTGQQIWQKTMQDASPIDPPNEMSGFIDDSDFGWTLKLTSQGLARIVFKGEPSLLVLEIIDPKDGNVKTSQTLKIKGTSGDFYDIPLVLGWQKDVAYLIIDTGFYTLDVTSGELIKIY